MKKNKMMWAVLPMMAAALVTASCAKENATAETPEDSNPKENVTCVTIPYTVTVGDAATRVDVGDDNKTLTFATGDKLYITGTGIKGTLDLQTGAGTASATFSGELTYSGGTPDDDLALTATLVSARQRNGTEITVDPTTNAVTVNYPTAAYCTSVISKAVQKYSHLTGTSTYGAKSFTLTQQTAFLNFAITFEDGTAAGTTLSTVVSNRGSDICTADVTTTTEDEKVVAKFVLPVAVSTNSLSGATVKMGTKPALDIANVTLTGKVYNVKRTLASFSVSADQKVYFSKGNLQYQANHSTWRFAEHQYDYVGDATKGTVYVDKTKSNNAKIAQNYAGWIDLFGWGTSGYSSWEDDTYGSAFQPWTSDSNNNNYGPVSVGNTHYGLYKNGENGPDFTNGDWGEGAKANIGDGWRTLTSAEWTYLFNGRTVTNCYCKATVDDNPGVVLFPDSYTGDAPISPNNAGAAYNTNKWNATQWAAKEADGCVFLPAAGSRGVTTVNAAGSFGFYWSSTPLSAVLACYLYFDDSSVSPAFNGGRRGGCSVRLVQNQ